MSLCWALVCWGLLLLLAGGWPGLTTSAHAQPGSSDRFLRDARPRVIGGAPASINDWPAIGTLRYRDAASGLSGHVCGGSMIAPTWMLTAAHCLVHVADESRLEGCFPDDKGVLHCGRLEVTLGSDDLARPLGGAVFRAVEIVVHEQFLATYRALRRKGQSIEDAVDGATRIAGNDIALVRIERPWGGAIQRLSLEPAADPQDPGTADLRVAGFGYYDKKEAQRRMRRFTRSGGETFFAGSSRLLSTKLPLVATPACQARYRKAFPDGAIGAGQLCAGTEAGTRDTCQGDSGGPLMAYDAQDEKYQVGIVSWGNGCAEPGWYGIYTRVSAHADWLAGRVGSLQGVRRADVSHAAGPAAPPSDGRLVEAALGQIAEALGPARGRLRVTIPGGQRVTLGREYRIDVRSDVAGRLIAIDIDASAKVTQIVPNIYMAEAGAEGLARIAAGTSLAMPPADGSWGFPAFRAEPPAGRGKLLVLVVPDHFPLEATVWAPEQRQRSRSFDASPRSAYLMNLVAEIEAALVRTRAGPDASRLPGWGYALLDIDIEP